MSRVGLVTRLFDNERCESGVAVFWDPKYTDACTDSMIGIRIPQRRTDHRSAGFVGG